MTGISREPAKKLQYDVRKQGRLGTARRKNGKFACRSEYSAWKGVNRVVKNAELLETAGSAAASREFLLAYQKAVLFTLYQDGILNQDQLERSIIKLEQQHNSVK